MNILNAWELGGFFATAVAAIIIYLKTKETPRWNLMLTVTLLGLIFSILISIRFEMIPIIDQAYRLCQLSEKENESELLRQVLSVKETHYYRSNGIFKRHFDDNIEKIRGMLKQAHEGEFVVKRENIPIFSDRLINTADNCIIATSYVKGTEWWLSHWGRKYEDINYRLCKKGIKIIRYFIFSNREEFEELKDVLRRHVASRIETYVVFNWETTYVHTEDLILIDGTISGRLVLDPEKNMEKAVMSMNPIDIRAVKERFEKINKISIPASTVI